MSTKKKILQQTAPIVSGESTTSQMAYTLSIKLPPKTCSYFMDTTNRFKLRIYTRPLLALGEGVASPKPIAAT